MFLRARRRGGIGRRAGLKIQWPQGRVGSSPSAGNPSGNGHQFSSSFSSSRHIGIQRVFDYENEDEDDLAASPLRVSDTSRLYARRTTAMFIRERKAGRAGSKRTP
jgi:hypothetical protein